MPKRLWVALIVLAPFALIALGVQVAATVGITGVAQMALGARAQDSGQLLDGVATTQRAAAILDRTWSSPAARVLEYNPITLGVVDDLRASAVAVADSAAALTPLAELGALVLGFDGEPPLVSGATIDTARVSELAGPVSELHGDLATLTSALTEVDGSGLLGRPIAAIADSLRGTAADLTALTGSAELAMPDLAEALGSVETRRYLVCALNDAETFGSGGAPLSAMVIEAVRGTISVPISGQLESKLSPNNPPIVWEHEGGPPWYRATKRYPFVNSNFHPDFRTAAVDMQRAWAALGYPEVQGVLTIDVSALALILEWVGPVSTVGYGEVSGETLLPTLLVDAYRQFNSPEGVLERHARNDELTAALTAHVASPMSLLPALRATMDAIPPRHIQASFEAAGLQSAVENMAATGALADRPGDLIAVHSQSGPNKLTVFQERTISQEVRLTPDGGAQVRRTVTFVNAVPEGLEGDPTTYAGYLALRARMRVAYRLPLAATDTSIRTGTSIALVPVARTGPFPDERGGQVLWQGHETAPGDATTIEMRYSLPAGTFRPGSYEVSADPQALPTEVRLRVRLIPPPGMLLPDATGWTRAGEDLTWSGTLDRPLHLVVG